MKDDNPKPQRFRTVVGGLLLFASPGVAAGLVVTSAVVFPGLFESSPLGDAIAFGLWGAASLASAAGGYLVATVSAQKEARFGAVVAGLVFGAMTFFLTMVTLWGNLIGT